MLYRPAPEHVSDQVSLPFPMNSRESPSPPSAAIDLTRALTNSEQRYALLIERVGYGVYRSTIDGRFIEANTALANMLGYASPDEMGALDLARDVYMDPRDRDRLRANADNACPEWVATRWKRRDGSAIKVRLSVRQLVDADGNVYAAEGPNSIAQAGGAFTKYSVGR